MAELKPLGRQYGQPSAPDISGAIEAETVIGKIVKGVSGAVGEYHKKAAELEASVLYADVAHKIKKLGIEQSTPQNIAAGNAYERSLQNANTLIEEAVQLAPPNHKQQIKSKLMAIAQDDALKLLAKTNDYNIKQSIANIEIAQDTAKTDYKNAVATGDSFAAGQAKEELIKLYDNAIELGIYSPKDKHDGLNALRQDEIYEKYFKRGQNDAIANPGEAERQLQEFARDFADAELTNSEMVDAITAYQKGLAFTNSQLQSQRNINFAQTKQQIDRGEIITDADIEQKDLTALQIEQSKSYLTSHNKKAIEAQRKVGVALQKVQAGGGAQNTLTKEEREATFLKMGQRLLEIRREETGNDNYELTEEDEIMLLKEFNTSLPHLKERMVYAALNADAKTELPLINQVLTYARRLESETPNVLNALDKKTRTILNKVNADLLASNGGNLTNIIEQARAAVNPTDVQQRERVNRWNALTEKDKRKLYEETFPDNPLINSDTYAQFKNKLELYNTTSPDISTALTSVKQEMQPVFGADKFFPKGQVGYLPSKAAVPFSDVGHWYENQVLLEVYALAKRQESDPDLAPQDKIKWLYPEIPEKLDEDTLMKDRLQLKLLYEGKAAQPLVGGNEIEVQWRGKKAKVYYQADGLSRIQDNNAVKYTFYLIGEDGQKYFIRDPKSKDGSGFATYYPIPLPDFLPQTYADINSERSQHVIRQAYQAKRREEKGTRVGTLEHLAEEKRKDIAELEKNLKPHLEHVPELKGSRPKTHKIVESLLNEGGE